jgi:hypothetical protein
MQYEHGKLNPELPWRRGGGGGGGRRRRRRIFISQLDLNLRKKPVKCYIWETALCGAEIRTVRKVDQKYLESFELWCWRRIEKISCADCVGNEEVLQRVKKGRNILNVT